MSQRDLIDYHQRRAGEEDRRRDCAANQLVARAHDRLADLHRQRAQELQGQGPPAIAFARAT